MSELPEVNKRGRLPLRLEILTYAKLIVYSFVLLYTITGLISKYQHEIDNYLDITIYLIVPTLASVDFVFLIIFVVGAHMKNAKIIRLVYLEGICLHIIYILIFIPWSMFTLLGFTGWLVIDSIWIWAFMLLLIIMQLYFMVLLKSEVIKLERNKNCQLANQTVEGSTVKGGANV